MFGHLSTFGKLVPILPTLQPYHPTTLQPYPRLRLPSDPYHFAEYNSVLHADGTHGNAAGVLWLVGCA